MSRLHRISRTLQDQLDDSRDALAGSKTVVIISAAGATYLDKSHMGKAVHMTSGSANAPTLPNDTVAPDIQIGDSCLIYMAGAGQSTITAGSGVTLRKAGATAKILAQYGEVRVTKRAANTWSLNGELAAS